MKTLFTLFALIISTSCFAEADITTASVSARQTCAEIQTKITELSAITEPDTETIDEITKLKSDYRKKCSRSAASRRSSANDRVTIESDTTETTAAETYDKPQPAIPVEPTPTAEPIVDTETVSEISPEQELANLDAGLCADGSTPNKFGCCGDELFKDLGNTVFACCPPDGGDCFPPLN